jgi:hypothetical protein
MIKAASCFKYLRDVTVYYVVVASRVDKMPPQPIHSNEGRGMLLVGAY